MAGWVADGGRWLIAKHRALDPHHALHLRQNLRQPKSEGRAALVHLRTDAYASTLTAKSLSTQRSRIELRKCSKG